MNVWVRLVLADLFRKLILELFVACVTSENAHLRGSLAN